MASPQQITMFVSDFDRLSDQRDMAAYRALGAISAAICFCKQNRAKDALAVLTSALERYEQADQELQSFKIQLPQENHHGNAAAN